MGKTKFKYPPCRINPETEKPYLTHKWVIPTMEVDGQRLPKTRYDNNQGLVYHVICQRCKLRDPRPVRY